MLKPNEVANELRRIAAALDNSKKPQREAVAADIKKVMDSLKDAPAQAPRK